MRKYLPTLLRRLLPFRTVTPDTLQQWGEKTPDQDSFTNACLRVIKTRQTDVADVLLELSSSKNQYIRLLSLATWAYICDKDRGRAKTNMLAPVFLQVMRGMLAYDETDVKLANKILEENLKIARSIEKKKKGKIDLDDTMMFSETIRQYARIVLKSEPVSELTKKEIEKCVNAIQDHPWIVDLETRRFLDLANLKKFVNLK